MCDLTVDVAAICTAHGYSPEFLDGCIDQARELEADGLCVVVGRQVTTPEANRRLVRVTAACFDRAFGLVAFLVAFLVGFFMIASPWSSA